MTTATITPPSTNQEVYTNLVARVMHIDEVTWGGEREGFLVRYRGRLLTESSSAYDRLAELAKPLDVTPLFRLEDDRQTVVLMQGVIRPQPSKAWVNLVMFIITLFSVMLAGAFYSYDGPTVNNEIELFRNLFASLGTGWPFAVSLLAILLAHEFGHYIAARYHGTAVTLPYFLPMPMPGSFGTMGAFIQLKAPPKNKRILLDIGIAGPLAGLVVAIPVILYGIYLSSVEYIPLGQGFVAEGNSLLYLFFKYIIHGQLLPAPASFGGISPVLYWLRYFFTGLPAPLGGYDIMLHPVAWAGWAGLLVTALNLIPAGQLDGGHVLFVLLGRYARKVLPLILVMLALLGFIWPGWWLWTALIFFLGRRHAEPLDQITPLNPARKAIAILGLVIFLLVFVPVPLRQFFGPLA